MGIDRFMTKDVVTCSPADTLSRAAQLMWERDCGCVPVIAGAKVVGMITDRDICMATYLNGQAPSAIRVEQVMNARPITCGPDESFDSVCEMMKKHQVRRMPVVGAGGKLLGLISLNDLALRAAENAGRTPTDHQVLWIEQTLAAVSRPRASNGRQRA